MSNLSYGCCTKASDVSSLRLRRYETNAQSRRERGEHGGEGALLMRAVACIEHLRAVAQRRFPPMIFDVVVGGSDAEAAWRANRRDLVAAEIDCCVPMSGYSLPGAAQPYLVHA